MICSFIDMLCICLCFGCCVEVMLCVLFDVMVVECCVICEVVFVVGVLEVELIEELFVVGFGVGLLVIELVGLMVIDIGGGMIEVVVIVFGGIVYCEVICVGGS